MTPHDAIWNRARSDIVLVTPKGDEDVFLWEHSSRVARTALSLLNLSELQSERSDRLAVLAAALYHDACWVSRIREQSISRMELLIRPATAAQRELSQQMLSQSLATYMGAESINRACDAIRKLNERVQDTIESRVLSDAVNLEEFGLASLWGTVRRGALDGKGVAAYLEQYDRRREYQYWTARLNEGFHWPAVRAMASQRLEALEQFVETLRQQHGGADLPLLRSESPMDRKQPTSKPG